MRAYPFSRLRVDESSLCGTFFFGRNPYCFALFMVPCNVVEVFAAIFSEIFATPSRRSLLASLNFFKL